MGVFGLKYFIHQQSEWLKRHKLRQTKIVVDGNNLMHHLYHDFKCEWVYSGEYDLFALELKKFIESFKKCDIELLIVWDGCRSKSGNKSEVLQSRAEEKLSSLRDLNENQRKRKPLIPFLLQVTFISVLEECHIWHLTCPEESDSHIAILANHLNCPVLSDDSDFFIFPLTAGVIPISTLYYKEKYEQRSPSGKHFYLECEIFKQDFIQLEKEAMTYKPETMPLLATLLGNDFKKDINLPEIVAKFIIPKCRNRILDLLNWLHGQPNTETAIKEVLQHVPVDKKEHVVDVISKSIQEYSTEDTWIIKKWLKGRPIDHDQDGYFNWLPERVKTQFYEGKLNKLVLSCIHSGKSYLSIGVEDITKPSIFYASKYIRLVLYSLYAPPEFDVDMQVIENIRFESEFKEEVVKLSSIPADYKLLDLTRANLLHVLNIGMGDVPFGDNSPFSTVIAVMKCWLYATNYSVEIIRQELVAALLTAFYLIVHTFRREIGITSLEMLNERSKMIKTFEKYTRYSQLSALTSLHYYNEIQGLYSSFINLNYYFNSAFPVLHPQHVFCGRLFHKLCSVQLQQLNRDTSGFIDELLGTNTHLSLLFYQLHNVFDTTCRENNQRN